MSEDCIHLALLSLEADVIVLTEYLPSSDKEDSRFRALLTDYNTVVSDEDGKENRVLIAAKTDVELGARPVDGSILSARSNYLHVRFPVLALDVVGLRVPCYDGKWKAYRRPYSDWLVQNLNPLAHKRTLVIGDFNFDPYDDRKELKPNQRWIADCFYNGLSASNERDDPDAKWFFRSSDVPGNSFATGSRLDHAMFTREMLKVAPRNGQYVYSKGEFTFLTKNRASDHAAFQMEID